MKHVIKDLAYLDSAPEDKTLVSETKLELMRLRQLFWDSFYLLDHIDKSNLMPVIVSTLRHPPVRLCEAIPLR